MKLLCSPCLRTRQVVPVGAGIYSRLVVFSLGLKVNSRESFFGFSNKF